MLIDNIDSTVENDIISFLFISILAIFALDEFNATPLCFEYQSNTALDLEIANLKIKLYSTNKIMKSYNNFYFVEIIGVMIVDFNTTYSYVKSDVVSHNE